MPAPSTFVEDEAPASFQADDSPSTFVADNTPSSFVADEQPDYEGALTILGTAIDSIAKAKQGFQVAAAGYNAPEEPSLRPMTLMEKLRQSPVARTLLGPTEAERKGMVDESSGSQMGLAEIPEAMMHFTSPGIPPVRKAMEAYQKAEDAVTTPLINYLPEPVKKIAQAARGAVKGVRDFALDVPIAPIPGASRGKAALVALSAFGADWLAQQPQVYSSFKEAVDRGDVEQAVKIATSDVSGGALLALGAKHSVAEIKANNLRAVGAPETAKVIEESQPTKESPNAIQIESPNAEVLRESQPGLELPKVAEGNTTPEIAAKPEAKTEIVPDESLRVTVQKPTPMGKETVPGYVQVDSMVGGENQWSSDPVKLKAQGYDIPSTEELQQLPQGQYTLAEAKQRLSARDKILGKKETGAVTETQKQPWEMRKSEGDKWIDQNAINAVKTDKGRIIAKNMEHGDLMPMLEESGSTFNNPNARGWALIGRKPSESYIGIDDVQKASGDFHKAYVMKALREGKPVPPEVLADYPDLTTEKSSSPSANTEGAAENVSLVGESQPPSVAQPGLSTEEISAVGAAPGSPLTPSTPSVNPLPPKSQREIITDLSKGLGVPVRFGRLTSTKFAGYFKQISNLIGSKKANDVPVVSHEVGHKLDKRFNLSRDPALVAELSVLGDPATPGSRSSWTPSKSLAYKHAEGVSEFTRLWLTDDAAAQAAAPKIYSVFEGLLNANKDIGDVMRQAKGDIKVWREAEPQARLRSHISIGENPNQTRYTLSQLTRDLIDDLHILRLSTEEAGKSGALPPSKDPYLLARNLRGSYGMAETFVRSGTVDFKSKEVKLGTSLEDALSPVAGRINDFRDWIVAKRAQELHSQNRETGLVPSDINAVAKKFDGDKEFQAAFTKLKDWNDSLLKYAEDSGLISADGANAIRDMNADYVPFHRLFEVGAGEAPSIESAGIGTGLNVGRPGSLKRLEGSTRNIVDPLETMVKNAYALITASEKAAINKAVADMAELPNMGQWVERVASPQKKVDVDVGTLRKQLESAGADLTKVKDDTLLSFFRPNRQTPYGENVIRVIKDGEPQYYRMNKDLHDTFQALDLEDSGKLVRMLSAPAQLLRAGVVLEPSFNVANALRDTFSSAVIGKYGALPFETTLRGFAAMLKNPQVVAEWAASGGKSAVEANFFDRKKMQQFLAEKISKDLTPSEQAMVVVKSPLTALRYLTSAFEEATRIGEYKITLDKLTKSGMPIGEARRLAAFEARDRQDFAKGGAKTKIVRHMAAFWNASLQANVKLAQAFRQRPARTILQGLAFVTIPKLIEQAVNWNDQDYWDRPQWERDAFFLIPIGKDAGGHTSFLRIPTPFEVGVIFGTLPGRILQWAKTERHESIREFPGVMLKSSVPNPIPQTLQMVFENFLSGKQGWDVFRGRPIVPDKLADLPAELQWTEQTSDSAKKLGKLLGYSPMKIDHIIEQTTGGLGKVLSGKQVPGQRFVSAPLGVSNQPTDDFYNILSELRGRREAGKQRDGEGGSVPMLTDFESTARQMSALRKRIQHSTDESEKAELQNQMLDIAKRRIEQYRASKKE